MKNGPDNAGSDKATRDSFRELGSKILAVPKAEIERREYQWQKQRPAKRKRR